MVLAMIFWYTFLWIRNRAAGFLCCFHSLSLHGLAFQFILFYSVNRKTYLSWLPFYIQKIDTTFEKGFIRFLFDNYCFITYKNIAIFSKSYTPWLMYINPGGKFYSDSFCFFYSVYSVNQIHLNIERFIFHQIL